MNVSNNTAWVENTKRPLCTCGKLATYRSTIYKGLYSYYEWECEDCIKFCHGFDYQKLAINK